MTGNALTSEPNDNAIPKVRRERQKLLRQYPGLLYRLAIRKRLSQSLLSQVFHGLKTSAKYRRLIEDEIVRRRNATPEDVRAA